MKNITDFINESIVSESLGNTLIKNFEKVYKFITSSQFKRFTDKFYSDETIEAEWLDEIYDDLIDALIHINSRAITAAENTTAKNEKEFFEEFQDMWKADPVMMWEGCEAEEQAVSMAGTAYADVYYEVTHKAIDFEINL